MSRTMDTQGRTIRSTWLIFVVAACAAPSLLQAQVEGGVSQALGDCRRNIGSNPRDGQRSCREALAQIEMAEFPEEYRHKKTEAFRLLGESLYRGGRITAAVAYLDSVKSRTQEGHALREQAESYSSEIARLFKPLRITIKDRLIPRLAYIKGFDREIRYPTRLEKAQSKRIDILKDEQSASETEFQFVGFDPSGQAYLEIDYFPVPTFEGEMETYFSLIVEGRRRYRFSHTADSNKPLEIYWEEDAGWELIERVPDGMVKLEIPRLYEFDVTAGEELLKRTDEEKHHIYINAGTQAELALQSSEGQIWERVYEVAAYGLTGLSALIAVLGAR